MYVAQCLPPLLWDSPIPYLKANEALPKEERR
jgi:hypothetical protein